MTKFPITSILVVYIHCFEYIPQHIGKAEPVHKTVLYQNADTGQLVVFGHWLSIFFSDIGGGILLMA